MADEVSRRSLLFGAAGLVVGAAAIGGMSYTALSSGGAGASGGPSRVLARAEEVSRAEEARSRTGEVVTRTLRAEPTRVDLGGRVVDTLAYNGQVPGPELRCTAGDRLRVELDNRLPDPSTAHWHGLAIRNDMDGVPNLTQDPVRPGSTKTYEFTAPDPGTYWSHPHVGVQRAHGLYAPLIVEDPHERGDYDAEFVVVLDDWLDGMAAAPEQVLGTLRAAKGMHPGYRTDVEAGRIEDRSGTWEYDVPEALAEPPAGVEPEPPQARLKGQVDYPAYLINGRLPTDPQTFIGHGRARIRLINASGSTVFRVALGEHRLRITHTDGFPVEPVDVDTLQLGSGERYDVVTDLKSGVFPLVGVAEGKKAQAFALVRTSKAASAPQPTAQPAELGGELLRLTDLRATAEVDTGSRAAGRTGTLYLTGDMMRFGWSINAKAYDPDRPFTSVEPLDIREGETVRLDFVNQGNMYHPMHLHGHTFAVREIADIAGGAPTRLPRGTRKDTVMVAPGRRVGVDFTADNPGQWLVHCHNAYHMATGMASLVSYVR